MEDETLKPAYVRYTLRRGQEDLTKRLYAVSAMLIGAQVAVPSGTQAIDYGLLEGLRRTIANARVSLDAFRREEKLPDAGLPDRESIAELLRTGEEGDAPFERVRQWIRENPPRGEVKAYLEARDDGR